MIPRFSTLLVLLVGLFVFSACDSGEVDPPDMTDTTPPSASNASASSNGSSVTVTFNEAIDPTSVSASNFSVTPGPIAVASATASGASITVTFASGLDDDERVTYTVTGSGIRDMAGNTGSFSQTFSYGSGGSGNASQELGAAYPNAGDNRINLFNTDGDRFLLFNPTTGAVTEADDLDDVESGADGGIPLSSVGAAASVFSDEETVFFSTDGDTYTKYERDQSDFDMPASFEEEYDEFGYDLDGVGAAFGSNGERIVIFNRNGTQWQEWYTGSDGFTNVFSFPADFGDGSAPISSVGAAFYVEEDNEIYLINRQGTMYTIYSGNGFTAAFPISELGDFEF